LSALATLLTTIGIGFAGAANGIILPIALAVILIAATKSSIMKGYKHPLWMQVVGWLL
jgi:Mn2+/Fe2+ NRAMP family transporter